MSHMGPQGMYNVGMTIAIRIVMVLVVIVAATWLFISDTRRKGPRR